MKFIISSSALLKQLQAISGVLANNSSLPILEDFLFEIAEGQIKVFASDLDNTISTIIQAEASEPGRVAIPAKMLLDSLKSFPDQPLTFLINDENFGIEIASGYGKYKLTGHDPDEFPRLPELEDASTFEVDASTLFSGINKTIFATGNDDLRPVMSGVFMQVGPDHMTMVATDSHRLVRYRRNDVKASEDASFILPKKPLNLLKNLLGYHDGMVGIRFNAKNASFAFDQIVLVCRLIEGRYPNYEAVIPKENPFRLSMSRQDLMSSIRRVAIFSSRSTNQVKLSIHGSELQLTAEDPDYANSASERLTCQYEGEDMDIAFNSKFINEMLSNLETDRIHLNMSAPNRAGILLPDSETSDSEEDLLMLVMPVMLNN
jgi:DNA polymerase III subunit beta